MKKIVAILLVVVLLGASSYSTFWHAEEDSKDINVVCSFWPEKVFALNVIGDLKGFNVNVIIPPSGTPHGFQLTPKSMKAIASADIIIANGYIEDFLGKLIEKYPQKRILLSTDRIKMMKNKYGNAVAEKEDDEHEEHQHGEYNPHTWLSINNAISEVCTIRDALIEIAPAHKDALLTNSNAYIVKLHQLAIEFITASSKFKKRNIVTFHNAFDYMARDLGLNVIDVVMKVPGTPPTPREAIQLLAKIKRTDAEIFSEPQFPARVGELLAQKTGKKIHILDPGVTTEASADGYEKVMRKNLKVLTAALSQ